ncbi:hypothetical protein Tco_0499490 [Tanacetum coccineum]
MCMFALTVSIVEPKNIKEAMADTCKIEAIAGKNFIRFDRLQFWELGDKPIVKKRKMVLISKNHLAPIASLGGLSGFLSHNCCHTSLLSTYQMGS